MRRSRENDRLRLQHMFDAAQLAIDFVQSTDRETVENNYILQNGLAKTIQDIGEAANNLTPGFRSEHPGIPWRDITDMRNFLVHVYFEIDIEILWKTATEDVPPLLDWLEEMLRSDIS